MLQDLTSLPPDEWDRIITEELATAGIRPKKFRESDSQGWSVHHTLCGDIGDWTLVRDTTVWLLWCMVPLGTAEVIASNKVCQDGAIPKQWFGTRKDTSKPAEVHSLAKLPEFTHWVERKDTLLHADTGQSDHYKKTVIDDGGHSLALKVRFVLDPEAIGEPFVLYYTFFTLEALVKFVEVIKRHRLLPAEVFAPMK